MTFAALPTPWLAAVLLAAVVALAIASYHRARQLLPPARRWTLTALRAVTLVALLLLLWRPVRVEPAGDTGQSVAILLDASASMSLADVEGRQRFDVARELLDGRILPALATRFRVDVHTFGEALLPYHPSDAVASARESRLDLALEALATRHADRPLAAVIVLSDGAVQLGELEHGLATPAVPVHAVLVGADAPTRDREIRALTIGDPRVRDSLVELTATVVSRGESAGRVDVVLTQNGQPVETRQIPVTGESVAQEVTFHVAPSRQSPTIYTVDVAEGDGELTPRNNRQSVLAPPAGPPRQVLVLGGAPGHELGFLKRSLEEDPGLIVDSVVRQGENDRGEPTFFVQADTSRAPALGTGFPASLEALLGYDAVVLVNIEAATLPPRAPEWLTTFVARRGGGVVLNGSRSFVPAGLAGSPFEPVVPVSLMPKAGGLPRELRGPREPLRVALTERGEVHPIMKLGTTVAETRSGWEAAPALAEVVALGDPRPGADLLAITAATGGVTRPLVVAQRYGRGRAVAFAGEASWRWKMMRPAGDVTYDRFWRQAVRWAAAEATPPVDARVAVEGGRRLVVTAEVRDARFEPVREADVVVRITEPSGRIIELGPQRRTTDGLLVATFRAEESGVHTVTVTARRGDDLLGTATAWGLVGGVDREFVDPRRHVDALADLTTRTGGRLLTDSGLGELAGAIERSRPAGNVGIQRELWHSWWVWAGLVALLGTEWTLRRRWGLR